MKKHKDMEQFAQHLNDMLEKGGTPLNILKEIKQIPIQMKYAHRDDVSNTCIPPTSDSSLSAEIIDTMVDIIHTLYWEHPTIDSFYVYLYRNSIPVIKGMGEDAELAIFSMENDDHNPVPNLRNDCQSLQCTWGEYRELCGDDFRQILIDHILKKQLFSQEKYAVNFVIMD